MPFFAVSAERMEEEFEEGAGNSDCTCMEACPNIISIKYINEETNLMGLILEQLFSFGKGKIWQKKCSSLLIHP